MGFLRRADQDSFCLCLDKIYKDILSFDYLKIGIVFFLYSYIYLDCEPTPL